MDLITEGQGIQVRWETDYGCKGVCRDSEGTWDGVKDCNYNFREGHEIKFWLELTDDGVVTDRRGPKTATT